jgi:hypothetical protein
LSLVRRLADISLAMGVVTLLNPFSLVNYSIAHRDMRA